MNSAPSLRKPWKVCIAEPLVTIACEAPKGQTENYGAITAATSGKPPPPNKLSVAVPDGFNAKPTFIVDSSRKQLTMIWNDTPAELAMRDLAKSQGIKMQPEPARQLPVIGFSPIVITALDSHPGKNGLVALYSFYPALGVMFVAQHYLDINAADAVQSSFVAKCEYSWSGTP
jgi:hypothetical protein